jgi:hypothetical protein
MKRRGFVACLNLLLLPLAGLAAGCGIIDSLDGYADAKDLQNVGVAAPAEILSIGETGISIDREPVIRLEVEVRPPNEAPYRATIKRLLISYLEVPQYQPGTIIGVRYDPKDPSRVSIDLGPKRAAQTGDPFRDNFTPGSEVSAAFLPPPPVPALYRGGADDAADVRALIENGYVPLGASGFHGGAADPRQAVEQGKRIGAALVLLYGDSTGTAAGAPLAPLPFRPRPPGGDASGESQVASVASGQATIGSLPPPSRTEHTATYWARSQPPVLGIDSRPLDAQEKTRMLRNDGLVVVDVVNGSPAAAAHIQEGDVIVAIDGKPILDARAVPAFLGSIAGHQVRIDLLRNGTPLAMTVQLNPPAGR